MFSAIDHPDFKLNEQQEAVLGYIRDLTEYGRQEWFVAYDLHGKYAVVSGRDTKIKIGDAGRRMRELRQEGVLESRKRGRFEEYRIIVTPQPLGRLF